MIYAAFTLWLVLILFAGIGVYRLWTKLVKPAWVNWALLPGTVVSEMAYIFGCLITGGEIRRAKLMPDGGGRKGDADGEPTTEATSGVKYVGPVVAALVAIVACAGAILAARALLGEPVIERFITADGSLRQAALPKELPANWNALWEQVATHEHLLRRMCETWTGVDWLNWRVPLFVYLSLCLAVRLSPVRRPARPTLAAVVLIAAMIAMTGLIWPRFGNLMEDVWPLLTYVWAILLFLLVVTLLLRGVVALVRILSAKGDES